MADEDYSLDSNDYSNDNDNLHLGERQTNFRPKYNDIMTDESNIQNENPNFNSTSADQNILHKLHNQQLVYEDFDHLCLESSSNFVNVYDTQLQASAVYTSDSVKMYQTEESPPCFNVQLNNNQTYQKVQNKSSTQTSPTKTTKNVTSAAVDGVQQTPLMFSRSSPLCTLSDYEIDSPFDIKSSIASDTSDNLDELISPSDIPDSPVGAIHYFNLKNNEKKFPKLALNDESYSRNSKHEGEMSESSLSLKDHSNHRSDFDMDDDVNDDESNDEVDKRALAKCWAAGLPSKKIENDLDSSSNDSVQIKDNLLLAKCLAAGLPQNYPSHSEMDYSSSDESTSVNDRRLITKCFVAGLPRKTHKNNNELDLSDDESDTVKDHNLIAKCFVAGLPKKPAR